MQTIYLSFICGKLLLIEQIKHFAMFDDQNFYFSLALKLILSAGLLTFCEPVQ